MQKIGSAALTLIGLMVVALAIVMYRQTEVMTAIGILDLARNGEVNHYVAMMVTAFVAMMLGGVGFVMGFKGLISRP